MMVVCIIPYMPLTIFMEAHLYSAMSLSIWYSVLMSGGKYFGCILIYYALDIGVSKKNPSYHRIEILHLGVHLKLCYLRVLFIPKETLMVMTCHPGIIVYLH